MKISVKHFVAVGALALASTSAFATASNAGYSNVGLNSSTSALGNTTATTGGSLTLSFFSSDTSNTYSMTANLGLTSSQVSAVEMSTPGMALTWDISAMLNQDSGWQNISTMVWGVSASNSTGKVATMTVNTSTGVTSVTNSQANFANTGLDSINATNNTEGSSVDFTKNLDANNNVNKSLSANLGAASGFYWTTDANSTLSMYSYVVGATRGAAAQNDAVSTAYAGTWSINLTAKTLTYTVASASAVPVPAAMWLMLSGLTGLGFIGRRKNAA